MTDTGPLNERELVLTRVLDAPRDKIYRCWTEPELLKQWFAPRPWTTPEVTVDLRAGGANTFVMADPEGNRYPNEGVYLEVVPNERIVFTDGYGEGWVPSEKPFFTGIIELADEGLGKTRYIARARHWTVEAREQHEQMGFYEGWGQCADQLEELAKTL